MRDELFRARRRPHPHRPTGPRTVGKETIMPTLEAPPRTLIEAQWIAPVRAADDTADECLVDHAVVLEEDRIVEVLPTAQARQRHPQAERIALPGHLLVPGFVNLHAHAAMSLLR